AAVVREERSFGARSTRLRLYARVAAAAVVAYGVVAYRSLASLTVDPEEGSLGPGVLLAPIGVIAAAALVAGALLRVVLPAAAAAARRRSTALF
ncbi:MAG: hypothetical protein M3273_09505, partial [Actinomycetota bacterium]|nr:hypothetical protein [Actinomycetota bacterium]